MFTRDDDITDHKISCQDLQLYFKGTIIMSANFMVNYTLVIVILLTTNKF